MGSYFPPLRRTFIHLKPYPEEEHERIEAPGFRGIRHQYIPGCGVASLSAQLENALSMMSALNVVPLLRESVRMELAGHWSRDANEKRNNILKSVAEVRTLLSVVRGRAIRA